MTRSPHPQGEQLVTTKLDRLGRSLERLIDLPGSAHPRRRPGRAGPSTPPTAVGWMFFQIFCSIAEFSVIWTRPDVRAHLRWPRRRTGLRPHRRSGAQARLPRDSGGPTDVRRDRRRRSPSLRSPPSSASPHPRSTATLTSWPRRDPVPGKDRRIQAVVATMGALGSNSSCCIA